MKISAGPKLLRNNFYVDDGLRSVSTREPATSLVKSTKMLCWKGGFNLHKSVSIHKAVIDSILQDGRSKVLQNLDLTNPKTYRRYTLRQC